MSDDINRNAISDNGLSVLVVDDVRFYRTMIRDLLATIPGIRVVGTASDGSEALEQIRKLQPDLVTLDIEMPKLNGLQTLQELKTRAKENHWVPEILMVSSLTHAGAKETLEALYLGAFDFICKPAMDGPGTGTELLDSLLREKIAAFREKFLSKTHGSNSRANIASDLSTNLEARSPELINTQKHRCDLVIIGGSTGGPRAVRHIATRLDSSLRVPILMVQHMPAQFTSTMAARLNDEVAIRVCELHDGQQTLDPACLYIAPGGRHAEIVGTSASWRVNVVEGPRHHGCCPSVDVTLESAARIMGGSVLTVIITGMGRDGLEGCRQLVQLGGHVFAQDETTSDVFGMPKAVIEAGLVDRVLPLGKIAPAIHRHVHRFGPPQPIRSEAIS
ncbi:MAG: chemotaxis-specific protein-glutamate methyltransferase CheB [Planctomycetota bacterium]